MCAVQGVGLWVFFNLVARQMQRSAAVHGQANSDQAPTEHAERCALLVSQSAEKACGPIVTRQLVDGPCAKSIAGAVEHVAEEVVTGVQVAGQ
jgi:hypothetical protein